MKKYAVVFFCFLILPAEKINAAVPAFIENKGQVTDTKGQERKDILYTIKSPGTNVFLTKTGLSYVLYGGEDAGDPENFFLHRIDLEFINANADPVIEEQNPLNGYLNFYYSSKRTEDVRSFQNIIFKNIYNGIDIIFRGSQLHGLEYDFIIHPGADPNGIKIKYSGFDDLSLSNDTLFIKSALGVLKEWKPRVYQKDNDKILDIKTKYALNDSIISFEIPNYNITLPLIIDPWVTYVGGNSLDHSKSVDTDASGNILITGTTISTNFPFSTGLIQFNSSGLFDSFCSKFDNNGNLLWSTFYGGSDYDYGSSAVFNSAGEVAMIGFTLSNDILLGTSPFQAANAGAGYWDDFILKLNANGQFLWATYLGGSKNESGAFQDVRGGADIFFDPSGNIVVTGSTCSDDFPFTTGAFQTQRASASAGISDMYIAKFDATGNGVWLTYYGGTSADDGRGITADNLGNIIACGTTLSSDFPVTAGAVKTSYTGTNRDIVLVKFDGNGQQLWSTYYGGTNSDYAWDIACDNNNIIIGGNSISADFLVTSGAFQSIKNGGYDAIVFKLNSAGAVLWSTYIGGGNDESGVGITIDNFNCVYLGGFTMSADFPVRCPFQVVIGGKADQFISKFSTAGILLSSTFLGGGNSDHGGDVACFGDHVFVTGTSEGSYPVTPLAFQTSYNSGMTDAVLAKICVQGNNNSPQINISASKQIICEGEQISYTSNVAVCDTTYTTYIWQFSGANTSQSSNTNPVGIMYNTGGNYETKLIVKTPCGLDSVSLFITVVPLPVIQAGPSVKIEEGSSAALTVSGGNGIYSWYPPEGLSCINCSDPVASPTVTTIYYVLSVNDSAGCLGLDSVLVEVTDIGCKGLSLFVPNAFSPNTDGINDILYLYNYANCIKDFLFIVYDRWGEIVFESRDIKNGWNGIYKNRALQTGVYYYTLFTSESGHLNSGNIILIR